MSVDPWPDTDRDRERITWNDAMSWDASQDIVPLSGDAGDIPHPRWDTEAQEKYLDDHVRRSVSRHDHGWDTGPGDRPPRRTGPMGHPMAAWDTGPGDRLPLSRTMYRGLTLQQARDAVSRLRDPEYIARHRDQMSRDIEAWDPRPTDRADG